MAFGITECLLKWYLGQAGVRASYTAREQEDNVSSKSFEAEMYLHGLNNALEIWYESVSLPFIKLAFLYLGAVSVVFITQGMVVANYLHNLLVLSHQRI